MGSFIPEKFKVPYVLETDRFRLRMLSAEDAEKDYEAVMESQKMLQSMFEGEWPREGFTLEENRADLERHQREFLNREAFAYTVVSLDESRVLGCVYINPSEDPEVDAEVRMWVRLREYERGLDLILFRAVKEWLEDAWPFNDVTYPGRGQE